MIIWTDKDLINTQSSLTLIITVLIIYNFFYFNLKEYNIENEKLFAIGSILGYLIHSLFTVKISNTINRFLLKTNTDNVISNTIYDIFKFSTIFIFQQFFVNGIDSLKDKSWILRSTLIIVGFAIFNLIKPLVPKVGEMQNVLNDTIKILLGFLCMFYFTNENNVITTQNYFKIGVYLLGYLIFNTFSIKLVSSFNNYMAYDSGISSYKTQYDDTGNNIKINND